MWSAAVNARPDRPTPAPDRHIRDGRSSGPTPRIVGSVGDPLEPVRRALAQDRTVDIVTRGARTGSRRRTEIWFTRIGDEVYICGTPSADGSPEGRQRRDWLANLIANPEFEFVLKESVVETLPATATVVRDLEERHRVFSAPETSWYRDRAGSTERLVDEAPLVKVTFREGARPLNAT